jgi:serine acetyltransferase
MARSSMKTLTVDILTIVLCYLPFVAALSLSYFLLNQLSSIFLMIFLSPFAIQLSFVFFIFIIRILLPRLTAGVFPIGFNKGFLAWFTHSMLTRSARCFGLHYILHSTALMRWLYWRALGADVPYNMSTSYKVTIHDAQLISIGADTILAEDVELSAHLVRGDKILVAPVKIGHGVFVGRDTYIGPRTRIGNKAWIGMKNTLTSATVADNESIKSYEWQSGKPQKGAADSE